MWDGAFSLARTINPTEEEAQTYQRFVEAALHGSKILQCPITPKVHIMLRHVFSQMIHLPGGMGDKMEDWVERLHQWGIRLRRRFRTVQDPLVRATAREKATSRCNHPEVLAQVSATDEQNKRIFLVKKDDDTISTKRKYQRSEGRIGAHQYFAENKDLKLTWAELLFNEREEKEQVDARDEL